MQFDGTVRLHRGDIDIQQMGKIGVFAESVVVPQEACYPLKDESKGHLLSPQAAALIGCCVTTGAGAVINSPVASAGMTVAVFGCGGVGLSVIQGARLMNASRIIAVDVYSHKLEFSYKFGATDVVNSRETDPVEAIVELTEGGVDMAFDSFGGSITTASAFSSVRKGGTAVVIGLSAPEESLPIDLYQMVVSQKSLVGSFYGSANPHETFGKLARFYSRGVLEVDSLITRTYSLDEINNGLEALERGEDGRGVILFG
jgi:S-(hydroxymethyl)glutathione dehydrogenase/alcohol dehydrogenase